MEQPTGPAEQERPGGPQGGPGTMPARDSSPFQGLEWRFVGPYRGGRCVAVAGHPTEPVVFYAGTTGGGVWRTSDGGRFWENVSDGYFQRASVGAIAIAPADPNVLYVGMGESCIRANVSHGDGVWKSTDGGKSWSHCGLRDTRHIARVRVHPQDPDLVYVAALGHAHGPNPERGVYRSRDGGRSWERVLFRSEDAGAIDLALDPTNPRVLYAACWEARRGPHYLTSGGPGSGIFKSTDGGATWVELSCNPGLPKGSLGRIGLAIAPARPERVWAIVEAEDGAVFRSDDGGATWQRLSEDRNLRQRAWYYHHIVADPQDPETVWVLNVEAWRSTDGGRTFERFPIPHGDNHDLWIDPRNPRRMICGNDGGALVSFNGGESWSDIYNQPTAELYHVTTDSRQPYRIYAAQQDNTTISFPSRSRIGAITHYEDLEVGGGESGYIAVRPDDPNVIYAGSYQGYLTRLDLRTNQARNIMVWPVFSSGWGAKDVKYRFNWTFPIVLSPHDPNVLYVAGNHVFRSTDEGQRWEPISPDLTRNDPRTLEPSGGPLTRDNTGAEYYGTIFTFAESPRERGLLWAGSDDGLVHVSRDGGQSWQNVTPPSLPPWALISIIEPSPHDPGTAYLAATRYKLDDFQPYLFKTSDYGQSWTRITTGIPEDQFTRVIRADPVRPGLLFCGTEAGVYVSFDDGASWRPLQTNLPVVPVHDLVIKDSDLVAATHGRGCWVLDDLAPLRALEPPAQRGEVVEPKASGSGARLFPPRTAVRYLPPGGFGHPPIVGKKNYRFVGPGMITFRPVEKRPGEKVDVYLDAGKNPPDGATVYFWLDGRPEGEVKLTFLDAQGREIKSFSSEEPKREEAPPPAVPGAPEEPKEPRVPKEPGLNRFVWNLRYPDATRLKGFMSEQTAAGVTGPLAPPGTYQVRLTIGEQRWTERFEVAPDPAVSVGAADLQAQFELLLALRDKLSAVHQAVNQIRDLKGQLEGWERRAKGQEPFAEVAERAKALKEQLSGVEEELVQVKEQASQDDLNFPIKLNAMLAGLVTAVASADGPPTAAQRAAFDELGARADEQLNRFKALLDGELAAFNALVRDQSVPAVLVPPAAS